MKPHFVRLAIVLCWPLVVIPAVFSSEQPFGLDDRVANITLNFPPQPPAPPEILFSVEDAFGPLSFDDPVVITSPPGETNRLFVVEQQGFISVITNLAAPNRTVFMNITNRVNGSGEQGLLGLAFHPGYQSNRFFYVFYTHFRDGTSATRHDRLSRFEIDPANPHAGLPDSEVVLIDQHDNNNNHNAGDCHFGPDGYLYVSLGDEGGGNDSQNNSQRIDKDFFSGIIRLDVDKRPGSLPASTHHASVIVNGIGEANYAVPPDNPWVGATSFNGLPVNPAAVLTEFYAVGLRNPWRMSFDPATGRLYCGDVGQLAREEIDVIVRGGNYGWAFREGFISGPKAAPPGANPINPILDYPRSEGFSVTGGVVYRGSRFPQLAGRYIFADYGSGRIWSTFYDGTNATPKTQMASNQGISAFGVDPSNGDVLMADLELNRVRRMVVVTNVVPFPETLEATGAFADLRTLEPHPGIIPYDVNVPAWNDHAVARRWLSIPNPSQRIFFRSEANWIFPSGSVWIQHLEMEMTNGVPASRRRLETRFLVRITPSPFAYGVTYRWDESQTNATLVPEEGMEETLAIQDGGETRIQIWRYPARAECLSCHRSTAGLAVGMNTPQMNRDYDYEGIVDNQLRAMDHAGYLLPSVANLHLQRSLAHPADESVSVNYRARSYLDANCAGCHRTGGSVPAFFDARIFPSLPETGLIDGELNNNGGDPDNRVVVRGDLDHSMLLTRMMATGEGRMPPVGSNVPDAEGIALIAQWITNSLPGYLTFAEWQTNHFGSSTAPEAQADADADGDGNDNDLERLTKTDPNGGEDFWRGPEIATEGVGVDIRYERVADRGFEVQWADEVEAPQWLPLNVPANAPVFGATNATATVSDVTTNAAQKIYRVRVFEP